MPCRQDAREHARGSPLATVRTLQWQRLSFHSLDFTAFRSLRSAERRRPTGVFRRLETHLAPSVLVGASFYFAKDRVTGFFVNFPIPASPHTTTEAERILCDFPSGFGCWFVAGMIGLFTFLELPSPGMSPRPPRPPSRFNAHTMKRFSVTVLTIVVLLTTAAFAAFFLFI